MRGKSLEENSGFGIEQGAERRVCTRRFPIPRFYFFRSDPRSFQLKTKQKTISARDVWLLLGQLFVTNPLE